MAEQARGIRFEASINLGHILTFIGFLLTGLAAFQLVDKRVVQLEENKRYQQLRDDSQDASTQQRQLEINNNLGEIKKSIERLDNKMDRLGR